MKKLFLIRSCLLLLIFLMALPSWGITTNTYYEEDRQSFITDAHFTIDAPPATISSIVLDFPKYNNWTLHKINGGKDKKTEVITYVNSVDYITDDQYGSFLMNFDLRLVWPFSKRGATINYTIVDVRMAEDGKMVQGITISLTEKNFTTREFVLDLEFTPNESGGMLVKFTCRLRLAAWLDFFFSLKRYRNDVEWRLLQVAENLKREALGEQ